MKCGSSGCLLGIVCILCGTTARGDDRELAAKARALLETHCYPCHGKEGMAKGSFGYVLDREKLLARNKIKPGSPGESELFKKVRDGEMPPPERKQRPGKDDLTLLEKWIAVGAPGLPEDAAPRAAISEGELPRVILADLQTVEARHQKYIRYLTYSHLAAAGVAERDLQTARLALAKLLNSLSWHPRIHQLRPVDPGRTVFRIDLRDLRWNVRLWERVLSFYPYRVPNGGRELKAIATASGTELAWVRADWFVATASRTPLYHELLQLPLADKQLERILQVDVAQNIQDETIVRAGFADSGVSRNNRMIERHDAGYGAYWRSYDFSDSLDRQNLFKHPLGPAPLGNDPFAHAGGEIIFSLPNGLQGYMLVDARGGRIDQGPIEIVSDPKRPDRKVESGLSCMTCHVRGINPKTDQVRAHVEKNPQAFTRADADTVRALYAPEARMNALIREDQQRFTQALAKLGISPEQEEPILTTVVRFEGPVDLDTAAAEAGLPSAEFSTRLNRSTTLNRPLGALRVKGGAVPRDTFQAAFTELMRELYSTQTATSPTTEPGPPAAFTGHRDTVLCAAFSPDGRQAISGSDDRTARLWDVSTGRELRRLEGHVDAVTAVAFSADGKLVATGSADRTVRVWDVSTAKPPRRLEGHGDRVRTVQFSPDGKLVASGCDDGSIRLWKVADGTEVRSLTGHTARVTGVAFSPDGRRLVSGSYDRSVRLWDAETGKELHRCEGHDREVFAVAFSPDGKQLLSGGNDRILRLWDAESGKEVRRFSGHANAIIRVSFSVGSRTVLSASSQYQGADRTLRVWDAETGKELYTLGGADEDRVGCAAFSPDGTAAVTGSSDTLRLWKLAK